MNMTTEGRKDRIIRSFTSRAGGYDAAADVQWLVAQRLAEHIEDSPLPPRARILEIGCGTGFLSVRLRKAFPQGALTLTDIAPSMLMRARQKVGEGPDYRVMDGERPDAVEGPFDLIASSLAFQWFVDLRVALERLYALLAPGGRLIFATLGHETFREWREAHARLDLPYGTPDYPSPQEIPWPPGCVHDFQEQKLLQSYADGTDFVKSLKALGAGEPAPGHRPLSTGAFRRLLHSLEGGFNATYHIITGEVIRP